MEKSIVELVGMLLRGITTDTIIDPLAAAALFAQSVQSLDLRYEHDAGIGFVIDDDENDVMQVTFEPDGVSFSDHHEHDKTLMVIHCALNTLTHLELVGTSEPAADDDDWDDWI